MKNEVVIEVIREYCEIDSSLIIKKLILKDGEFDTNKDNENRINKFINVINKYQNISRLDPILLNELIPSITIYDKEEKDGKIIQKIVIHYRFIGE